MKSIINIFAALSVMLVSVCCEKKEALDQNDGTGKVITLSATINNEPTKTSLGELNGNVYPVLWSEGDAIAVIQNGKKYEFVLSEGEGTTNGSFICSSAEEFNPDRPFVSYYPYNAVTVTDGNIICRIPDVQSYAASSFGQGAMPMSAVGNISGVIAFKNLFGAFKFSLKGAAGETVSGIQIGSSSVLCGNAILDATTGKLTLPTGKAPSNITLRMTEPVAIDTEKEFIVAIPAGDQQMAFVATTNKGSYYKRSSSAINIRASFMTSMALVDMEEPDPVDNSKKARDRMSILYPEDNTNGILIGTGLWANVNCGYEPATSTDKGYALGKLYQWGREHGQGYDGRDRIVDQSTDKSAVLVAGPVHYNQDDDLYPDKFFTNSTDPYDWVAWNSSTSSGNVGNRLDDMWNKGSETNPEKNPIFDPCPEGWRVPASAELEYLGQNGSSIETVGGIYGRWFTGSSAYTDGETKKVFLPCAGFRNPNGSHGNDVSGFYWSSTTSGESAKSLYFNASSSGPSSSGQITPRAGGLSIRCIKE